MKRTMRLILHLVGPTIAALIGCGMVAFLVDETARHYLRLGKEGYLILDWTLLIGCLGITVIVIREEFHSRKRGSTGKIKMQKKREPEPFSPGTPNEREIEQHYGQLIGPQKHDRVFGNDRQGGETMAKAMAYITLSAYVLAVIGLWRLWSKDHNILWWFLLTFAILTFLSRATVKTTFMDGVEKATTGGPIDQEVAVFRFWIYASMLITGPH